MKKLLTITIVCLTWLLGCCLYPELFVCHETEVAVVVDAGELDAPEDEPHFVDGVLQESASLARILNNNSPQRCRTSRVRNRFNNRHYLVRCLCNVCYGRFLSNKTSQLGERQRFASAPFETEASCRYYVFGLRRILC